MLLKALDAIRIVLIHTSHPGNIGSAARAMKTMGLSDLVLVNPKEFPSAKATELAAGADDILMQAQVVTSLDEALAGVTFIGGASARLRALPWPLLNPRDWSEKAMNHSGKVALLLGREDKGLLNDELQRCHYHVHIPASDAYSSLNLAAAVQVLAYELRLAALGSETTLCAPEEPLATAEEIQALYEHMAQALTDIHFLNPDNPRQLMPRLKRLFSKAHLDKQEVGILRGLLSAAQRGPQSHE